MPRAKDKEARERRNALIIRLFLVGQSRREIARNRDVRLSQTAVDNIIKRELADQAKHMQLLNSEALNIYVARNEMLIRALLPKAINGNDPNQIKAAEAVRRIMGSQARVFGLDSLDGESMIPVGRGVPGLDDEDSVDPAADEKSTVSKLDDYRRRMNA